MNLKEQILEATQGGLVILQQLFPFFDEKKSFKFDETEKSESCKAEYKDAAWKVCCFDPERAPRNGYLNAIDWYMHFHHLDFVDAIKSLGATYGTKSNLPVAMEFETIEEKREYTGFRIPIKTREVTEDEAKILGRYVKPSHCKELQIEYLESHEYTNKEGVTKLWKPTEFNPHFLLGLEKKIYAPKADDSRFRYMATEKMPDAKNVLRNFESVKKAYEKIEQPDGEKIKLGRCIIACGYRDAVNVLSTGNYVVWMSAEGLAVPASLIKQLSDMCEEIYYCGDIDGTGYKVAHELCSKHIDIKRIYLPEELKHKNDHRGKPCKDVSDYLRHYGDVAFDILINSAAPYRFWYQTKSGPKISRTWLKLFVIANGFRRFQFDDGKGYIHIEGNVVKSVEQDDIKAWVNKWAQSRGFGRPILDMISGTRDLSETVLNELPMQELQFSTSGPDHQLMVFEDKIWKITSETITELKNGSLETFVWHHKIGLRESGQVIKPRLKSSKPFKPDLFKKHIDKSYKPKPFFNITTGDTVDIELIDTSCQWFTFLINTCKVHWKDEVTLWAQDNGCAELSMNEKQRRYVKAVPVCITSKYLTEAQNDEQKRHLINRIFTMGFLMHRHKFRSKSWMTWCMDYKAESIKDSKGRSGKSLIPQAFEHLKTFSTENGRDHNLTKKNHIFADVTSLTDLMIINDCHNYLDLGYFFNYVTDNITVNPKNVAQRTIPFHQAGKIIVTSNYSPNQLDDSTMDRILFNLFGDWYHSEKDFGADYRPSDDFGGQLFDDWDEKEWNNYFNFMAQCCMVHFNLPKMNPPLEQIIKRQNMRDAGDMFSEWANELLLPLVNPKVEFNSEDPTFDGLVDWHQGAHIIRPEALKKYTEYANGKDKPSMNQFTKKLQAWAATQLIEINPEFMVPTKDGKKRNIRTISDSNGNKKSKECIFLFQNTPGEEYPQQPTELIPY